ncbi:MAG: hypothetical protein KDI09_19695, partial [Halioglobus sp.]|nr:hypothetical protein [Halioglobus sp.]
MPKTRPSLCTTIAAIVAGIALLYGCQPKPEPFLPRFGTIDLLIENARVVDGSGAEARDADLAVVGDNIVFVGDAGLADDDERVVRRIDAAGRVVAPGFIDLHSHGDPLETPAFENFLAMGVTTISLGEDGSSPEVADLSSWLGRVSREGIGPNLAMFVGHG